VQHREGAASRCRRVAAQRREGAQHAPEGDDVTTAQRALLAAGIVEREILVLRGHRVIIDEQLAPLYGVEVKVLNQAVKRNRERFPEDFMFQLTAEEARILRSQTVTLNVARGRGTHRKYRPYAFTEQGVAMLSSVLRSPRAVQVNIEIMRAFVRLRRMLKENVDLARKLAALEKRYDAQFKVVFDAIRELMEPPVQASRPIGFAKKSEP
jgi:hypothetical protein